MGLVSTVLVFLAGAFTGSVGLVILFIFAFNVGSKVLDASLQKKKDGKTSHLESRKSLPRQTPIKVANISSIAPPSLESPTKRKLIIEGSTTNVVARKFSLLTVVPALDSLRGKRCSCIRYQAEIRSHVGSIRTDQVGRATHEDQDRL
jgi:hypothetical protein